MRLDHVIYAAADLDAAAARIESELGLTTVAGGRHKGHGTHNRIVPLGGGYLELMAVDDVARIADRLALPITTVSRQGTTARLAGVGDALPNPVLPFFIERDEGIRDPGAQADAGGITWVEAAGDREALARRLGDGELPVSVVEGPVGVVAMGIGERALRND